MAKLHEVLAVEGDLRKTAEKIIEETGVIFGTRPAHFLGTEATTKHYADADSRLDVTEHKKMESTVTEKLAALGDMVARYYDVYLQKEATNQSANASVMVDGKEFMASVPVVVLLGMEQRLKELRDVYQNIPTLQAGPTWDRDATMPQGVYRSRHPEERFLTRKTKRAFVMYEATDKHPAQVQVLDEDAAIAKRTTTTWSGMLSVQEKAMLLGRIDTLIREFKQARQRANDAELVPRDIGKQVFDYLHGPLLAASPPTPRTQTTG